MFLLIFLKNNDIITREKRKGEKIMYFTYSAKEACYKTEFAREEIKNELRERIDGVILDAISRGKFMTIFKSIFPVPDDIKQELIQLGYEITEKEYNNGECFCLIIDWAEADENE